MGSSGDEGGARSVEELAREICAGAVRLAAAGAAWLALVAEFDAREGWGGYGVRSCAHWLSWQCGLSPGAAREHVRVARALRSLPVTAAAYAAGRLSYAKVRALTRVAEPHTETALLEFARAATAAQTERVVRQWRRADRTADEQADPAPPPAEPRFDVDWAEDGSLQLRVRLPAEEGARLLAAVDSLAERTARRERAAATKAATAAAQGTAATHPESAPGAGACAGDLRAHRSVTTARRCAALLSLAEAAADTGRRAGDPPRREVVVHVDAAVLADDAAAGRAHLEGGPALSPAQVRRLTCQATVVGMVHDGPEVLACGRRRRLATRAQRRALLRRDGGCARPGCEETRIERLHAHHLRHWLFGGRTDLTNLVLLCDVDHGLAHDLDLVMVRRGGRLIATTPDGRRVWGRADAAFTTGLPDPADPHPADPGAGPDPDEVFAGVHPVDRQVGRRPAAPASAEPATAPGRSRTAARSAARKPSARRDGGRARPAAPAPARGPGRRSRTGRVRRAAAPLPVPRTVAETLGSATADLPAAFAPTGERMDLGYVVSVLMGYRDHLFRLAADGGPVTDAG
ncbi:HNH endonuclease signature motif containing protein [Geodermatophilus marinus]|uniref:HNH endonuclease signature motif containing protein n=1 Tax=Geodermatophilus sp. LHW52908 TaxID=2303986 RepID=UPI000E3DD9F2|nr:HNH endonuclease signature motif containing protein [Geodermatophilus sp. LHW52908]RFU20905.1 HNH endonuclease [Geodermatophilus sp. LHW52908]